MNRETSSDRIQQLLDRIMNGERPEDVLAEAGDDLDAASCVLLAARLNEALPVAPDAGFRARLQTVLQDEHQFIHASRGRASARVWNRWSVVRRLAPQAVSLIVAVMLVLGSAVVASADSLPGESLYGVKRSVEGARLQLAFTPSQRNQAHQRQADERLWELRELMARGASVDPNLVNELRVSQDKALDAARSGDASLMHEAEARVGQTVDALVEMTDRADPELRPALQEALDDMRDSSEAVAPSEPSVDPDPASDDPTESPAVLPVDTVLPQATPHDPRPSRTVAAPGVAGTLTATATRPPIQQPTQPAPAHTEPPALPTQATATDTPLPATPEVATPRPTTEREGDRAATLTAEAAGATSRAVGPQGGSTPTPPMREPPPTKRSVRPPRGGGLPSGPPRIMPRPPTVRPAP